jgi:hypothetical protein
LTLREIGPQLATLKGGRRGPPTYRWPDGRIVARIGGVVVDFVGWLLKTSSLVGSTDFGPARL